MKIKRNQLLMMLLVTGFFAGIVYRSTMGGGTIVFNKMVLEQFKLYKINQERYLLFVVKERIGILLLILFLSQVYWRKIFGGILTTIIGVMFGSLVSASICKMGAKGLLILMTGMLPHMFFYGLSYGIVICYLMDDKKRRWTASKSLGMCFFMSLGILTETYLNPLLFKLFL